MKLSKVFTKSRFQKTGPENRVSENMGDRKHSFKLSKTDPEGLHTGIAEERVEAIDWELRPGGMLVQRRDPAADPTTSLGPLVKVKVSHGLYQHDITIPAQATFGEMKWLLIQETGLQPHEQRLLFRGKEEEDNEYLHIAGVKDKSKIILVEDPASKERKLEELKRNGNIAKGCEAVAQVREEVNLLAGKVTSLEGLVSSGSKVADQEFTVVLELLMRQLIKLDSIEAEGDAKMQRRIEVRRVQRFVETVDLLKVRNNNPISSNTMVTTQWETFDSGMGSLAAPPAAAASTISTNWEVFD